MWGSIVWRSQFKMQIWVFLFKTKKNTSLKSLKLKIFHLFDDKLFLPTFFFLLFNVSLNKEKLNV